jgi:ribosomal protein S18 acetylase RimI-like enzyme
MNVPAGAPERIWFDLSFGRQQAYAVAELAAVPAAGPLPPRLEISLVGPEALDEVVGLSDIITRHQALSPVFSRSTDAWLASLRGSIAEELAGGEARCLLARRAGVAVGFTLSFDTGPGLLAPAGAVELSVAAVPPAERGTGIGEALTAAVVADARERGAGHLVADWRTTNLLASRFWPRWGLRPVVYRMVRTIDLTPFA